MVLAVTGSDFAREMFRERLVLLEIRWWLLLAVDDFDHGEVGRPDPTVRSAAESRDVSVRSVALLESRSR